MSMVCLHVRFGLRAFCKRKRGVHLEKSRERATVRIAVSPRHLCAFVGFSFYCAMLRPPFLGSLATDTLPDPEAMRVSFDAAIILIGIVLATLPGAERIAGGKRQAFLRGAALFAPLAVLAVCIAREVGVSSSIYYNACFAALGIGFAALTACWFHRLADLLRSQVAVFFLGAFVASHILGLIDLLPREAAAAVSVAYPLASLASLSLCNALRCRDQDGKPRTAASDEPACLPTAADEFAVVMPSAPLQRKFFKRLRLLALTIIYIEILCGAFIRSAYSRGGINYTLGSHTDLTYLASAAIGIALLLIARKTRTATECTLAVGGTGLVGFTLITVLLSVLPLGSLVPFITGLYSALIVFMMALILLWRDDGDRESTACAGTFLALYGTASSITATIVPSLLSYQGSMPTEYLAPMGTFAGMIVALGVAVALVAMVFIQRETFLEVVKKAQTLPAPAAAPASADPNALRDAAMEVLAQRFGLTERERQTASLIARGYTAKRVAEAMTVALSTVQGYNKSIYRKVGIHRKDELIEIVSGIEKELRDGENAECKTSS